MSRLTTDSVVERDGARGCPRRTGRWTAGWRRYRCPVGELIRDRYEPLAVVGRGGQGEVWRALDRVHGRQVALKVRRFGSDAERDAILSEASILLAVAPHPNLAVAREDFVLGTSCYLVMDWVEGRHLGAVLDTEGLPGLEFERVAGYLAQVADGLDHLHDQAPPVVHGDVKPTNLVLAPDGRVVLVDFGIASRWGGDHGSPWGSPSYAAPETATGRPVPASDVYGLAVTAYTLMTGAPPTPEVRPAFAGLGADAHDGVLRALRRGLATDPGLRPATPVALVEALRAGAAAAPSNGAVPAPVAAASLPECPYRGLFAFREADARFFFGREDVTAALVDKVAEVPFVAVVGASGSGKSSLVWAGLVPWLRRNDRWVVAGFRPGPRPFHSLAAAFLALIDPSLSESDRLAGIDRLAAAFAIRDGFVAETARRVVAEAGAERMLVVVDQFEELYAGAAADSTRFVDRLLEACGAGPDPAAAPAVSVVVTLRADFLGHALDHRPLSDALQRGDLKLGPMAGAELVAAVEQPAQASGVGIEDGLTRRLLDAIAGEPGNLPLLSFALTQLWGHQEGGALTHAAYERMGGVERALAGYADDVFDGLGPDDQRRARSVLLQLVRPGEGTEDTRRRSTRDEIGEDGWRIVPALAGARLVVTGRDDATGTETVEVVHEALIRQWGRLRRWMSAERAFRTWQERFRGALRQWEASGWDDGALLRGGPLAEATDQMAGRPGSGSTAERQFLEASLASGARQEERAADSRLRELESARAIAEEHRLRAEAETARARAQVRSSRLLRLASAGLVVLLVVAVATAAAVRNQRNESRRLRLVALVEAMAARVGAELEEKLDERAILVARQAYLFDRETGGSRNPVVDRALRQALGVPNFSRIIGGWDRPLASVAVSPDGRFVAGGGVARTPTGSRRERETVPVVVRDLDDPGAEPRRLEGHAGTVTAVAWRPTGGQLASGGADGTVRLWRPGRERPEVRVVDLGMPVTSLAFGPDGSVLVAGAADGTLTAVDLRDPDAEPATVAVSPGAVAAVAFGPSGRDLVAAAGDDGVVRLVDVQPWGTVTAELDASAPVRSLAFDRDGVTLAVGTATGSAVLWDVDPPAPDPPRRELAGHAGAVSSIAFSPDGTTLATGSEDRTIRLWALRNGAAPVILDGHTAAVTSVAFADEGRPTLLSGSRDRTVRIWQLGESGPVRAVLAPHRGRVAAADFSDSGRHLATAGATDRVVHVHDLAEPGAAPRVLEGHAGDLTGVGFGPGDVVVTGARDGTVRLWSATVPEPVVIDVGGPVSALDVGPRIPAMAVAVGRTVRVYKLEAGRGGARGAVGEPVVLRHPDDVTAVALSGDGRRVVSAAADATVRVWDALRGGEPLAVHTGHSGRVGSVAWSPDGSRVASGGDDLSVRIWPARGSGARPLVLSGPKGAVTSLAFSPDGAQLAAASDDGRIRIWDMAAPEAAPLVLRSHPTAPSVVVFNPDGDQIASGGDGGSVVIEPTRTATLATYACQRVGRDLTAREWRELVGPALPYRPVCSRRTT